MKHHPGMPVSSSPPSFEPASLPNLKTNRRPACAGGQCWTCCPIWQPLTATPSLSVPAWTVAICWVADRPLPVELGGTAGSRLMFGCLPCSSGIPCWRLSPGSPAAIPSAMPGKSTPSRPQRIARVCVPVSSPDLRQRRDSRPRGPASTTDAGAIYWAQTVGMLISAERIVAPPRRPSEALSASYCRNCPDSPKQPHHSQRASPFLVHRSPPDGRTQLTMTSHDRVHFVEGESGTCLAPEQVPSLVVG